MRNPAYIIMMIVTRAIKPFKKIIILTIVPKKIFVSKIRFVHSVGIPNNLLHPQSLHPYAILTIGSAASMMMKPIAAAIKVFFQL